MGKLNFYFSPHDDMLEARIQTKSQIGFYHIIPYGNGMKVTGYVTDDFKNRGESFDLGEVPDIYTALDLANSDYQKRNI